MLNKFLAFSKEKNLIQKGDKILVGVSGGIDSVALLDILSKLRNKLSLNIHIAHVNYGLRKESASDERFVSSLASKHGFNFHLKRVRLSDGNIEEKAREARYEFFNDIALKKGLNKIAVAHQKNDLVETFFLNSARGSGLRGLVSMKPLSGHLIRPLLFAKRQEIENYTKKNRLKHVEDSSNKDLKYTRNLIRHRVIPDLERVNPELVEVVAKEIDGLRAAEELISKLVIEKYKKLATETDEIVEFSVKKLANLDDYEMSEIFRMAILNVKGDLKNISRKNIEDLTKITKTSFGTKRISLPASLIAERRYDKLEIRKGEKKLEIKPKNQELKVGKEVTFGMWKLFLSKDEKKEAEENKNLVFLDIQKTPKLLIRFKRTGDRVEIEGGSKKLQDLFVDEKIPADERRFYPVVSTLDDDKIVWIPGLRLNPTYKTTEKLALKLTGKKIEKK